MESSPQFRKKHRANDKQKHTNIIYNQKTIRQREKLLEKDNHLDKDKK